MPRRMRPATLLALAATLLLPSLAAATTVTLPGVTVTDETSGIPAVPAATAVPATAFAATVSGSGRYQLRATLSGGGSFTVTSDPAWTAVYPRVVVPVGPSGTVHLEPRLDAARSSAPSSTWNIAGALPGLGAAALTRFTCLGMLQAPGVAPVGDAPSVDATPSQATLTLPALGAMAPATSGCTPAQADGHAGWSSDLRTWTAALVTATPKELRTSEVIERDFDVTTVAGAKGRLIGACRVAGTCDHDLRWTGSVTLAKRCRDLAGTLTTGATPVFRCASPCYERTCGRERVRVLGQAAALRLRRGTIPVPVACYGDSACTGVATLRSGGAIIGRAGYRLAPSAAAHVRVPLRAAAARRLRAAGAQRATVRLSPTGDAVRRTATAALRIRA